MTLTAREDEVLRLIASGFTHEEIGEQLGISHKGATATVNRMLLRLGALNAPHAVLLACQAGLLGGRTKKRPGPPRMPLTPRQAEVLTASADGAPLTEIASRLGTTRPQVAARLAEAYQRLGVTDLPRRQRRAAAVRTARTRGLIPNPTKEIAT